MATYWWLKTKWLVLGAFEKWLATVVLVMSTLATVCDLGSPRLLPDECSWNLIPSILTEIGLHSPVVGYDGLHSPVVGYDRPELRETLREVLRWVTELVFRTGRGCVLCEVRSKLLVYCEKSYRESDISPFTRQVSQKKTVSRHLRD